LLTAASSGITTGPVLRLPRVSVQSLSSPRCRSVALLLLYVALGAVTRLVVSQVDVINVDEASYMVGASELMRGNLPYASFGDNKPPLIYLFYAFAQLVAGGGIGAVRLVTALAVVPATAFAISAFYRHDRRGVTAAVLFLVYSAAYTASDMLAVNCEVLMMLPLAWALVAVNRPGRARHAGWVFAAGLLIGVAALVKYQAGLWVPAIALAVVYAGWTDPRRRLIVVLTAMGLGLALPVLVTVTWFGLAGGLDGLVYWNVTHNLEYLQNPISAWDAAARGASRVGPFLAVTAVLWYGWLRASTCGVSRYWELLTASLIGASAAAACLGFRFFPHYFIQLYVPLTVAAAPWTARALRWPLRAPGWAVATATVAICAGWTVSNVNRLHANTAPRLNAPAEAVADRLQADRCYGDSSLFVWGSAPEFYYHAGLPLASQFFFPEYPLVRYYAGNPVATAARVGNGRRTRRIRRWSRLMNDLRTSRPTFILDTAPSGIARWQHFPVRDYPLLQRFIHRHYTHIDTVSNVAIYRRTDCTPVADSRPDDAPR